MFQIYTGQILVPHFTTMVENVTIILGWGSPVLGSTCILFFLYFIFIGLQTFVIEICSVSILMVRKYTGADRK